MQKILIIDENQEETELLEVVLGEEYDVKIVSTAKEGLVCAETGEYSLIFLDAAMREMEDFGLLKELQGKIMPWHISVILLMDEAFSALDPLIRREMQDELLELQAKFQKTIIFVSHDLNEALRIGDRIAIMKDGKIMQIGTGEEILTNPANDYVKTFVEDVDRAKVITAENIMIPALTTNIDVDGPSVALKKMKTEEVSSLMAVDKKRQFRGVVTSEQAIAARKNNQPLKDVMTTDVGTVSKEMLVRDILPIIYDAPTPLAVVDDNGFLKGVLIRGSVLEALADIPDEDEVEEIEKEEENK